MALLVVVVDPAAGLGPGDRHSQLCHCEVAPRLLPLGPLLHFLLIGSLLPTGLLGFQFLLFGKREAAPVGLELDGSNSLFPLASGLCTTARYRRAAYLLLALLMLLLLLLLVVCFTGVAAARLLLHVLPMLLRDCRCSPAVTFLHRGWPTLATAVVREEQSRCRHGPAHAFAAASAVGAADAVVLFGFLLQLTIICIFAGMPV